MPPQTPSHEAYEQPTTSEQSQPYNAKAAESPGPPTDYQKPRNPVMPGPPNIDTLYVSENPPASPPLDKDMLREEGDGESGKKVDDSGRSSRLSGDEAPQRFQAKKASASHKQDSTVLEDL